MKMDVKCKRDCNGHELLGVSRHPLAEIIRPYQSFMEALLRSDGTPSGRGVGVVMRRGSRLAHRR
jgi:hypothetical protein